MDKIFIDSNIWIYAFIAADALTKRETCINLLETLYQEKIIVVSTQVVNSLYRRFSINQLIENKLKIINPFIS